MVDQVRPEMPTASPDLLLRRLCSHQDDASMNNMDVQIARIANGSAPLYSLPNELITDIIHRLVICRDDHFIHHNFPIIASHITHRLREVTLNSPILWTQIRISRTISPDQAGAFLHRSRTCLLDVEVYLDDSRDLS